MRLDPNSCLNWWLQACDFIVTGQNLWKLDLHWCLEVAWSLMVSHSLCFTSACQLLIGFSWWAAYVCEVWCLHLMALEVINPVGWVMIWTGSVIIVRCCHQRLSVVHGLVSMKLFSQSFWISNSTFWNGSWSHLNRRTLQLCYQMFFTRLTPLKQHQVHVPSKHDKLAATFPHQMCPISSKPHPQYSSYHKFHHKLSWYNHPILGRSCVQRCQAQQISLLSCHQSFYILPRCHQ